MVVIWLMAMASFGLAILSAVMFSVTLFTPSESTIIFLAITLSLFVSGVLLLALNKIIELLTEIREGIRVPSPEAIARREAAAKMDKYL